MNANIEKEIFGQQVLGPIFYDFCRKLYMHQLAYDGTAVCLYAFRGGARLLYLFEKYLKNEKRHLANEQKGFLTSRICALKGTIYRAYNKAEQILLREYRGEDLQNVVKRLVPDQAIALPRPWRTRIIDSRAVYEMVHGHSPWAQNIQRYFSQQELILKRYIASLSRGKKNLLLVDTGWSGTTQYFLMKGFPEINWHGIYFGKWDTWRENPEHFHTITGVFAEGTKYRFHKPETAVFNYHHIIEGPLEPRIPSVEQLNMDPNGQIGPRKEFDAGMIPPQTDEPYFKGICNFFNSPRQYSPEEMSERAYAARVKLRQMIIRPNRNDVQVMVVDPRSADFGKKRKIPIISSNRRGEKFLQRFKGIKKSIWRQGKIVNDFPVLYPVILLVYNLFTGIRPRYINKVVKLLKV